MYVVPADGKKDRKKIPDVGRMHSKFWKLFEKIQ